ncbi:MAG: hypothetical protein ACI8VT_002723 [Saprospiraceae bacterium]|jgi:hypothetical protein
MSKNTIGIKYGILAGVGLMLYFLLFYYMDKNRMMDAWVSWSSLFLVLICTFLAVSQQRETNGGIIEFKEALKTGFTVIVLSNLLYYAFFFVLLKSDLELVTILKQNGIDFYKSILPEEEWPAMEKSYENFSFGFSDVLQYFAKSTIGGFFIALLVAGLLKRSTVR